MAIGGSNKMTARLVDLIPEAGRLILKRLEEDLRPHRLTLAQVEILEMLWAKGRVSQREIIEARGVEAATVGTTLSRLERDGWVERLPDPTDKRGKLVAPTQKTVDAKEAIQVTIDKLEAEFADQFGITDGVVDLINLLREKATSAKVGR